MKIRQIFIAFALAAATLPTMAQSLWTTVEAEKKIVGNLGAYAELEYRTHDGMESTERFSGTVGLEYKIFKFLKANAGYSYIHQQTEDEVTKKGNFIPAYWQPRHRGFFALTGSYKWKNFEFSLRERYQYTYRTEQSVDKFDEDGDRKADELVEGKGKHILRSRLEVEYKIKKCDITPFISYELYSGLQNAMATDKMRYTVGASYKINKKHSVNAYYRYIDHSDDDESAGHIIGIGYKIKL